MSLFTTQRCQDAFYRIFLIVLGVAIVSFVRCFCDLAFAAPLSGALVVRLPSIDFKTLPPGAFSEFASSAVRRYFMLSNRASIKEIHSQLSNVREVEVGVCTHCLAPKLAGPWQRMRFEFMLIADPTEAPKTHKPQLIVRALSGQHADWRNVGEPPAGRQKQYIVIELTELGKEFAANVQVAFLVGRVSPKTLKFSDEEPGGDCE